MKVISVEIEQTFFQQYYFEIQFAAVFGGIFILFLLEELIPRRRTNNKNQTMRWLSNIALALINFFFSHVYVFLFIGFLLKFEPESPVLQAFNISDFGSLIIIILIIEFISYWIHRAYHTFPSLWPIHTIHHTDTEFDVTTSQRNHPFELIISSVFISPIVLLLGAPAIVLTIHYFLQTAVSLITHSNIIIPKNIDRILRWFVVTPDFHRMHHASDRKYTDSNYSVIIPIFDYLFKTSSKIDNQKLPDMELGLDVLRTSQDNRVDKLLIQPFTYRQTIRELKVK